MCRSGLIRQSCVTRITKHAEWPGLLCWCWDHRSEHPAPLGGCDGERLSPVGYDKLTQKASAVSSSHHAEVCDALLNIRNGSTATTGAHGPDHARRNHFANSSAHYHSPDRDRSDLCSQHQHKRTGRFCAFRRAQPLVARVAALRARVAVTRIPDQFRIEPMLQVHMLKFFTCVAE